jgi:organic hydroperoxide reductase OsmC/OhrA
MSTHTAEILWQRNGASFVDSRYSRGHRWRFDGGVEVPASASPHNVPLPHAVEAAVDPEEAFVASLSSCHMLWFLFLAARRGLVVEVYRDPAEGILSRDAEGFLAMTQVTLRPEITYAGAAPSPAEEAALHHEAHDRCFIARSVKTEVRVQPAPR